MELLKYETDTSAAHSGAGGVGETSDLVISNSNGAFSWHVKTSE